jgi:hypothetical protein
MDCVAMGQITGAIDLNSFALSRGEHARLFTFRTLGAGLAACFLLWASIEVHAGNHAVDSERYQKVWAPRVIEFVLVTDLATAHADAGATSLPGFDQTSIGSTIRDSLSAYAGAMGLSISFLDPASPCADGVVTARIVITAPAGELSVSDSRRGAAKFAKLPIRVESQGDCGYRRDAYERSIRFDVPVPGGQVGGGGTLAEALARFSQDLIDEVLLVWHPAWKVPEPGSNLFSVFALEPISPPASMGFLKGLFSGRGGRGLNGLVVTRIETAQPEFRWTSLSELLSLPGQSEFAAPVSDVTYQFRLYAAADTGLGLVPGRLLLERANLTQPLLRLPAPLESCQSYFWTARALFKLGGFPRATEWMSQHNASGGIAAPWQFRRGESVRNAWNPAITYAAFVTPSATGKGGCGR